MNQYTKFDIPLRSGRQVWNHITSERSQEKGMIYVQTSGGRILPRYEKGAKAVVDRLPELYQKVGHYLWSDHLERHDRKRSKVGSEICGALCDRVKAQDRKQQWKDNAIALIPYAAMETRWVNPPASETRGKLYDYTVLAEAITTDPRHWHRDHQEKWNFLKDELTLWMNYAEQAVYDWMRSKTEAV